MDRQHSIREYELFVTDGVQEISESAFEREPRAAGEYRVIRGPHNEPASPIQDYPGTLLGESTIDLSTGELLEEE